jgi:hypothetical protein
LIPLAKPNINDGFFNADRLVLLFEKKGTFVMDLAAISQPFSTI